MGQRLRRLGLPAKYCYHIDRLQNLIRKNKSYKIVIICNANHVPELCNIISKRDIDKIYTLGHCTDPQISHKEVTTIGTNERDLIFDIVTETVRYTQLEQLKELEQQNHSVVNALALDLFKLFDLLKTLR